MIMIEVDGKKDVAPWATVGNLWTLPERRCAYLSNLESAFDGL